MDLTGLLVPPVAGETKELLDSSDLTETLVDQERREKLGTQDQMAHVVTVDTQGSKGMPGTLDPMEMMVKMGQMDLTGQRVRLEQLGPLVVLGITVIMVVLELGGPLDPLATRESRDPEEMQEDLDRRVLQDQLGLLDPQGNKDKLVPMDQRA